MKNTEQKITLLATKVNELTEYVERIAQHLYNVNQKYCELNYKLSKMSKILKLEVIR